MSLSKTTLSAIQQAGQALHKATLVVLEEVRAQAKHMVATVTSEPFQAEGEQAFTNFKLLARLSQDLVSLEDKLKTLYGTATDLASPERDVVAALAHSSIRSRATVSATANVAEDVVVKPSSSRRAKRVSKQVSKKAPKSSSMNAAKGITLTVNDSKVLQYMNSVLKPGQTSAITGLAIAKGAGLPLGSVGVSVKKVLASGAVKKSGRGTYLLGA